MVKSASGQELSLDGAWRFKGTKEQTWLPANVPGTIHTDLLAAGRIPDPYYGGNEQKVQWVGEQGWEYRRDFRVPAKLLQSPELYLQADGLDTWADIYLNDSFILHADNMFRQWTMPVKRLLKAGNNSVRVHFFAPALVAKAQKSFETIPYPDNERIYARKAQYQYGWDWGPRMITAGIWRSIRLTAHPQTFAAAPQKPAWQLVTKDDAAGQSFYFTKDGKPVYIKGANWIPLDNFIPRAVKSGRYEQVIREAAEAGINMLRVWGGGIYEDDIFYDLCDKYGIVVWQDFMFAGAMYPGDSAFLKNVEEEVRYQVKRLRHHPCLALWCGNNEIDEAWHNWGWQSSLHYSAADSTKLWSDYQRLFHQLIPGILNELDPGRSYWPSSPSTGWGRDEAYKRGDVHYWGVWWGKEPASRYREKVGRFNSEYGMQAFPDMATIKAFSKPADWDTASFVMRVHQKHPFGYPNISMYISQRFPQPKKFEDLVYVSGLMQADAVGEAIRAHRGAKPYNMGTMYWQLNDCWPVVSWSSLDYYGRKKPLHYRLKELYAPLLISADTAGERLRITVSSDVDVADSLRLLLSWQYLGRAEGWPDTMLTISVRADSARHYYVYIPKEMRAHPRDVFGHVSVLDTPGDSLSVIAFLAPPKDLRLVAPEIEWGLKGDSLWLHAEHLVYGVQISLPDGVTASDNYFHLTPGVLKWVRLRRTGKTRLKKSDARVRSLWDVRPVGTR